MPGHSLDLSSEADVRETGNGLFHVLLGLLPLAVTTIAACSSQAQSPLAVPGGGGSGLCAANNLDQFFGRTRSEQLGSEIRRQSGATTIRWVPEGTMVTMDFRGERVTVHLDGSNRVRRAVCG